jgi:hypothetical protein
MTRRSGRSARRLLISGILSPIILAASPIVLADDTNTEVSTKELGRQLTDYGEKLGQLADDYETQRRATETELKNLQNLLREQKISEQAARTKAESLQSKISLSAQKQQELNDKYKEIDSNFEKYVFQTRAEAIVPFFYAIAAISLASGSFGDKALYALAGYGTGALIENTGYGLARGITWLRYERFF